MTIMITFDPNVNVSQKPTSEWTLGGLKAAITLEFLEQSNPFICVPLYYYRSNINVYSYLQTDCHFIYLSSFLARGEIIN